MGWLMKSWLPMQEKKKNSLTKKDSVMNLYKNNLIRFDQQEEPETPATENPIEKMMGGMVFDKKFIEQRKVFLWGEVHDKSAREVTNRLLYLEAIDPGKEITFYINSPGG